MGAFDALEWVWHLLRSDKSLTPDDAYRRVQEALASMGTSNAPNFRQRISEIQTHH
jgi:hypothetical protein